MTGYIARPASTFKVSVQPRLGDPTMRAHDFYLQSDPDRNRHFRRRWGQPADLPRPASRERTLDDIANELAVAWRRTSKANRQEA